MSGRHRRPSSSKRPAPSPATLARRAVRRRTAGAVFGGGAIGVLVLALLLGLLVWALPAKAADKLLPWFPGQPAAPPSSSLDAARELGYDLVFSPNVPADKTWTFPVDAQAYQANACDKDESCTPLARVFADARLTRQLDADVVASATEFSVSGAAADAFADPPCAMDDSGRCKAAAASTTQVARQGKWTLAAEYYLARYFDEDGLKLPRPQVTMFTVDEPRLPAPRLEMNVASDGSIDFSWPAASGATGYTVLSVTRRAPAYADGAETGVAAYRVVGETTGTSLNSLDASGEREYLARVLSDASVKATGAQNLALDAAGFELTTQDDVLAKGKNPLAEYDPSANGMPEVTYAVLATGGETTSTIEETAATALLARVPVALAPKVNAGLGRDAGCDGGLTLAQCLSRFTTMAVTMADGHLVDRAAQFVALPGHVKCTPPGQKAKNCWRLRAVAYGTKLVASWTMNLPGDGPTSADKKAIEKRNKVNFDAWQAVSSDAGEYRAPNTAPVGSMLYTEIKPTVGPVVAYGVNGSTDLVRFIGAHIDAGHTKFDIPAAILPGEKMSVEDPFYEALSQNPMALMTSVWWSTDSNKNSVTLDITIGVDEKKLATKREKVAKKVESVAASIFSPGMSDREKALAINRWLSRNATYDNAAYDASKKLGSKYTVKQWEPYIKKHSDSGTAAGVLLNGKGLCASYAAAFKALADAGGLRAIVVTGKADGEGHAWNKVFMDGKWKVVDPTWNDGYAESGGSVTRYFGLRDGSDNHAQDKDWMTDSFISYYAAK